MYPKTNDMNKNNNNNTPKAANLPFKANSLLPSDDSNEDGSFRKMANL
jgi:hypothetical protein